MSDNAPHLRPNELCPHCGKPNRYHMLGSVRGTCEIIQREKREAERLAQLARTGRFLNAKSFGHYARGIDFKADYCDLKHGIELTSQWPVRLDDLLRAVATTFGWHGVNIHPELNGFSGYDTVKLDISQLTVVELQQEKARGDSNFGDALHNAGRVVQEQKRAEAAERLVRSAFADHRTRCDVCPWCEGVEKHFAEQEKAHESR